jgi:hypothetical protein
MNFAPKQRRPTNKREGFWQLVFDWSLAPTAADLEARLETIGAAFVRLTPAERATVEIMRMALTIRKDGKNGEDRQIDVGRRALAE